MFEGDEGQKCGICMDVVVDRGVLDCCQHWYMPHLILSIFFFYFFYFRLWGEIWFDNISLLFIVIDIAYHSCNFRFCFSCIDNWASITNLCPLCQNEFQIITCVPVSYVLSVLFNYCRLFIEELNKKYATLLWEYFSSKFFLKSNSLIHCHLVILN